MKIPQRFHTGLADGSVTLAFRRRRRPAARAGGRQRTPIGELAIDAVEPVELDAVTEADARAAGYRDRDTDVRKLKKPGLTESLRVGYRLSTRGRTVIARLDDRAGAGG